MRSYPLEVAEALRASTRSPRFVVTIQYPTSSPHFTSKIDYQRFNIQNAGFETGDETGWFPNAEWSVSSLDAISGGFSARVQTGTTGARSFTYDAVPGETYRVTCRVKRDENDLPDSDLDMYLRWIETPDNPPLSSTHEAASSAVAGEQVLSVIATVPDAKTGFRVTLRKPSGASGTWICDDITVEKFVGIANVPGVPVHGVLRNLSGTSQEIHPDEGRSTIGSFSFEIVDVGGAMTDELRDQLANNDRGPRRLEVRAYMGFSDDFTEFARIATYQLVSVELTENVYRVSCADIQREMRDQIFVRAKTRLNASLTDSANSMTVLDTSGFAMCPHTGAFTDAPGSTVGYLLVKKTGEIIRYTGKTSTTFTGLTRGVFDTVAQPVTLTGNEEDDQKPEVEEFIYLEMPGPELAYALLTGVVRSSSSSPQDTIPSNWHLGIDESLVDGDAFDNIGLDLVDPDDDEAGRIMRFTHLDSTDGKQFIEEQLMFPMGCFMPINSEGVIGLKRMVRILTDAPYVAELNESNVISHSSLVHDQDSVINQVQVDWNYNGDEYTRTTLIVDGDSIDRNGLASIRKLKLRGVHVSRLSDRTIRQIARTLFDRYGEPPIRIDVEAFASMSFLEVGDVVRLKLPKIRDYQGAGTLDRSFEVQRAEQDWTTGRISLTLFGSAREVPEEQPEGDEAALPDGWYTGEGTELSTVLTISNDQVTANGSLTGNADLNNSGAIYYYDGDLTINSGVTVTISHNVQLRIKGTLTINGAIDGVGGGLSGTSNPNSSGSPNVLTFNAANYYGEVGFLGTTRAGDGIRALQQDFSGLYVNISAEPTWQTIGRHSSAPVLNLEVTGTLDSPQSPELLGLPADLRGTSGTAGLPVTHQGACALAGGDGGDGGAGLALICRGLAFGVSGEIDLSGGDGTAGENGTVTNTDLYGGSGGGGAPGALYVLLDGNDVTLPDLGGKFIANRGSTPEPGTPGRLAPETGINRIIFDTEPGMGAVQGLPASNMADSAHRVQYIPLEAGLGEGFDDIVTPPFDLTATDDASGVLLTWTLPPSREFDYIEVWESIDNNRSNATLLARVNGSALFRSSATEITRYYWIRAVDEERGVSEWEPVSSTGGVEATFGGGGDVDPSEIIFRQSSAPAHVEGRLWIDSDDLRIYRSDGVDWIEVTAGDALLLVNAPAEAGADTTVAHAADIIIRQSSAPSNPEEGWIWVDTDDSRIYRRTSGNWVQISANDVLIMTNAPAEAGADVTGANAGDIVFRQSSAPAHVVGRIWIDSDDSRVYRSTGSTWVQISALDALLLTNAPAESGADVTGSNANDIVFRQSSAPSHVVGRIWIDSDDFRVYRSTGSTWVQISANDALLLLNPAAEAGAQANEGRFDFTEGGAGGTQPIVSIDNAGQVIGRDDVDAQTSTAAGVWGNIKTFTVHGEGTITVRCEVDLNATGSTITPGQVRLLRNGGVVGTAQGSIGTANVEKVWTNIAVTAPTDVFIIQGNPGITDNNDPAPVRVNWFEVRAYHNRITRS